MILKKDCTHFPGDRPCAFHKKTGVHCPECTHYTPVGTRILVVKLDALGDVLRTTCILPAIKRKYPDAQITWLTKNNAVELFRNNPFVHRVQAVEHPAALAMLHAEHFDVILQPDASTFSASLATLASADIRFGYSLNTNGTIAPHNSDAASWLEHGAFDDLKQANTHTYQHWIYNILELPAPTDEIQLYLTDEEKEQTAFFHSRHELKKYDSIVGLNTGAGGRWKYKKWTAPHYEELIDELLRRNIGVVLFGGPEEKERNEQLAKLTGVIDSGTDNSLRTFFALLDVCDVLVTGDTMALHAITALGKPSVALFGPTSIHEIETYNRIQKIAPDMDCLCCYLMDCDKPVKCMENIQVDDVLQALSNIGVL